MSDTIPSSNDPIELIYRALEDERYWKDLLEIVRVRLQFTMATIAVTYPHDNAISFTYYAGVSDEELREYRETWGARNPWRNKLIARQAPLGALIKTEDLISDEELAADECWREFLGPKGLHHGFVALLAQDENQFSTIHGARATHLGPLTKSEMEWLQGLLPHLMRGVSLHGRLARLQSERDALLAYSDSLETGIILVNQSGNIHFANQPAEAILARGSELIRRDGRLCALDAHAQRRLESLILRAGNTLPDETRKAGTIAISRPEGGPLIVHVIPADSIRRTPVGAGVPDAIVWIIDLSGQSSVAIAPLQELFGLTPSEGKLCQDLVRGHSVREIAARWNVSIPTVRTHLAHALEKTATRRQSELVTLILRIANIPKPKTDADNHP